MSALPVIGASLIIVGLATLTVAVIGALRLRDVYLRLHSAAVGIVFGVVLVLAGAIGTADRAIILRAALVAVFVLLTAPASAHAIGQAVYRQQDGKDD